MHTAPLLGLMGALILTLLVASLSIAGAEAGCDEAIVAKLDGCPPPTRGESLDRLMAGTCCGEDAAAECADVELAVAEELLAAQLREAGSALRHGADRDRLMASLKAAQVAWERYREVRCELLTVPETSDVGEHAALRDRCRFELTVERILELAEMQEKLQAADPRVVQLY
jgi:uncharacterized protein YecT (DUF1311 family)